MATPYIFGHFPSCCLMMFVHFIRICCKAATLLTHYSSLYSKYWSTKDILSSLVSRPLRPMPSFYIKIQTILIFLKLPLTSQDSHFCFCSTLHLCRDYLQTSTPTLKNFMLNLKMLKYISILLLKQMYFFPLYLLTGGRKQTYVILYSLMKTWGNGLFSHNWCFAIFEWIR